MEKMDKVRENYSESILNVVKLTEEVCSIFHGNDSIDSRSNGIARIEVDLTTHEKQFLLAVERGDIPSTRQMLEQVTVNGININCVDPMGRTALLISIENENIEMVQLLLRNQVEVGDALLHAINEENVEAVELLLIHLANTKGEKVYN